MKHYSESFNKRSRLIIPPELEGEHRRRLAPLDGATLKARLVDVLRVQQDFYPCFDWVFPRPCFPRRPVPAAPRISSSTLQSCQGPTAFICTFRSARRSAASATTASCPGAGAMRSPRTSTISCERWRCRRIHAAPYVTWLVVPAERFRYSSELPARLASSPGGSRDYCPSCGTHVACTNASHPERIDVAVGSLDSPEAFEPTLDVFVDTRLPWAARAEPAVTGR